MTIWIIAQFAFNLSMIFGLVYCFLKIQRDREEDVRINHGLRLLKSKIAVLEDLSEHTETQSKQVMSLMEKKIKEVKKLLRHINQNMLEVDKAVEKSERIAKKMSEEIPHQEIAERNMTNRYILAAKMAHQGTGVEAIVKQLGLPRNEVELITKVNRKKFVFDNKVPQIQPAPKHPRPNVDPLYADDYEEDEFQAVKIG